MANFIGLVPVPGDKPLGEFIKTLIDKDFELLRQKIIELNDTITETLEAEPEQPIEFAYAKLMNYLAKGISHPDLIHLCASALWHYGGTVGVFDKESGGA